MRTPDAPGFDGVYQCPSCGLLSALPYPDPARVAALYAEEGNWHLLAGEEQRLPMTRRLGVLDSLTAGRAGRAYEVGAFEGDFLALLRSRGWSVAGIEPAARAVAVARERHGIDLDHGLVTPASAGAPDFDAVFCWDVLEHCREPRATLDAVLSRVAPGGLAVFAVPHADGLPARIAGHRWRYRMTPWHLHFFPLDWFREAAGHDGFEVVRIDGFAKVHAWLQAALPEPLARRLVRAMPAGAENAPGDGKSYRGLRLRAGARRALLRINQTPVPLPMADLIEVWMRRTASAS